MATGISCMQILPAALTKPQPALAAPTPADRRAGWLCLAAAALSGVMLWMCYHPLAWGAYLGWVALVPLLVLVRSQARPRWIFFCALVAGILFFVPALQWMRYADSRMYATWLALALYCSLYFPAAIFMIRRLERWRLPLLVSVPLVWAALEYFRACFLTGFAWYLLAHTQHDVLPMIQIADLGGVFLISALVAAVNAFLFDCLYQQAEFRAAFNLSERFAGGNLFLQGIAITILLVGTYIYGINRLGHDRFETGPTVCLLQSNLDQRIRNDAGAPANNGHSAQPVASHFSALCVRAAINQGQKPDLLIWPETSYPGEWYEVSPKLPIEKVPMEWRDAEIHMRLTLEQLAGAYTKIPHLLGMNTSYLDENAKHRRYNSALLLDARGHA